MVKVRVRSVVNSRARTRGTAHAEERDQAVVNIFHRKGARLVDAHGSLVGSDNKPFEPVPPDTVVIFMAEVGYCAMTGVTRNLENEFFTSKAKLEEFFRGGAAVKGRHYGNAYNRTWLPGEEYPSIKLQFYDEKIKNMGFVYKLPLARRRPFPGTGNAPAMTEVNYPKENSGHWPRSPHHWILLKDLMARLGPGVYIISACIVPPGQIQPVYPAGRLPVNLPRRMPGYQPSVGWKRVAPRRTRETVRAGVHKSASGSLAIRRRPPRPGTPALTHIKHSAESVSGKRPGRITVGTALQRLSRVANLVNENKLRAKLNAMLPYMNANVNVSRLRNVIPYLKNPAQFLKNMNSENVTMNFYKTPKLNRGAYIHAMM